MAKIKFSTLRGLGAPAILLSLAVQGAFRSFKDTTTLPDDNMNSGGDQCHSNVLLGLALQGASAIAFKTIGALFPLDGNYYFNDLPPCLCDECKKGGFFFKFWKIFLKILANYAPARKVDDTASCEDLTNLFNNATEIHIPEEIIMDILSKLPVMSVLRFKCASKFWKTLISAPNFKTKHFNHARNIHQNSQKLLIGRKCPKDNSVLYYSSSLSSVQVFKDVQILGCPSNHRPRHYVILCCCDGLSLLWFHGEHSLWNPCTGESIVLPSLVFHPASSSRYGFGYDSTSDDYKILRIKDMGNGPPVPGEILTLKSGSWRKINELPHVDHLYKLSCMESLAFLHGAFHWIGVDTLSNYSVISFSISNEVYGEIPLSEEICNFFKTFSVDHGVSVLGGQLCAYCTKRNRSKEGTFKLWIMKDYGVRESWTEIFSIQKTHSRRITPKYMFADGKVLRFSDNNENRVFSTFKGLFGLWPKSPPIDQEFVFTESLISPKLLI